ncbi:MAG TPA: HAD family hydrolase [Clostridiales bacterium]|jgi:phosphoglycolate phosphatase|nr:HAD family hydrolase [Clostridiales bacterium]
MKHFIVFDLDGTLLNTLPDIATAMNRVLFRFGMPQHAIESYKQFTGNGAKVLTQRALAGQEEMVDHVYPAYLNEYARNSRVKTEPYEGIVDALKALHEKGIALIVYSNKDNPEAQDVIRHYFPDIPFAAVVGSLPDVPLKPDPTALRDLLSELELDPADGLYVGDTVMDMQCANAVGIYAVGALWGFQSKEELEEANPAVLIEAVPDLMRVVKERFGV